LRNETVEAYMDATSKLHSAIDQASKFAPTGDFSASGLESLVNKTADGIQQARREASLLGTIKELAAGNEGSGPTAVGAVALGHVMPGVGHLLGGGIGYGLHAAKDLLGNPARVAEILGHFERLNSATAGQVSKVAEAVVSGQKRQLGARAAQLTRAEFD